MRLLVALATFALVGCGGRGLPRFDKDDPVDAPTKRDAGASLRDGGLGVRDGGVRRDAGPSVCGDGLCDSAAGESFRTCPADCERGPGDCPAGTEGCACSSSWTPDSPAFARDDCDPTLVCVPWDDLSGRGPELTGSVQACVKPCTADAECGPNRRCSDAFELPPGQTTRICVDRLAEDDAYCGGTRASTSRLPGVRLRTPRAMVGCRAGATCFVSLADDTHVDEGICLERCTPGQASCPRALPYCNPVLADGFGVCSEGPLRPGAWCGPASDAHAGYTARCAQSTDADIVCVGLGIERGLCMEICNDNSGCRTPSPENPYYCVEGLLQNGDGICMSSGCDNFPDTCTGSGSTGAGQFCLELTEDRDGLCVDRLRPPLAATGLDGFGMVVAPGDDCQVGELAFAQCPEGTMCIGVSAGSGVCAAGCSLNQAGACGPLLMSLGLPAQDAVCGDLFQDGQSGICTGG